MPCHGALLQQAVSANRAEHTEQGEKASGERAKRTGLKARLSDLKKQQSLNGGDALEAAERAIEELSGDLETGRAERAKFDDRTRALGRHPETQEQFDTLRRDGEAFLAAFPPGKTASRNSVTRPSGTPHRSALSARSSG